MSALSLIHRYNRLNGNAIGLPKLKEFREAVQRHLDSVGHGPYVPDLKGILARTTALIKQMQAGGFEVVERLQVTPIATDKPVKQKPLAKAPQKATVAKREKRKAFKPKARGKRIETVDESFLYGLEHLQGETGLGEIGATTYQVITDKILLLMKDEGLIWRKPWNENHQGKQSLAHNYVTKRYYRGANYYLNYLLLSDFKSPYFLTFNQVDALKGKIRKGEKGWPVIYFKYLYKNLKTGKLVDEREAVANGTVKSGYSRFPALFYYMVWNADQCEGLNLKPFKPVKLTIKEKIATCEAIVEGMPKRPPITNVKGDRAFYVPSRDSITMPLMEQFKVDQEYYSTLFHEMVHSTGHSTRLGRDLTGRFGSKKYAFEELIAELGSSYLCGESGILYFTMNNSAAYVKGWLKRLREEMAADPKFFLKAAAAAEKASEFILDRSAKEKANTPRKPAAKKKTVLTKKVKKEVVVPAEKKPTAQVHGLGFISADQTPDAPKNTFTLPGVMGQLLGRLQRFKLQIIIPGETHSSKSQLGMQIANAFAALGDDVAWLDWEQGGLDSKDTQDMINRNTDPANRKRIHVTGTIPRTLEAVKKLAGQFKVIALDSGTKIKGQINNAWLDDLREEHPEVVWIIMMQQNATGGTRGGSAAEFDAPVVLKTYRPDHSNFMKNYATVFKNRGNKTGINYLINAKQIAAAPTTNNEQRSTTLPTAA